MKFVTNSQLSIGQEVPVPFVVAYFVEELKAKPSLFFFADEVWKNRPDNVSCFYRVDLESVSSLSRFVIFVVVIAEFASRHVYREKLAKTFNDLTLSHLQSDNQREFRGAMRSMRGFPFDTEASIGVKHPSEVRKTSFSVHYGDYRRNSVQGSTTRRKAVGSSEPKREASLGDDDMVCSSPKGLAGSARPGDGVAIRYEHKGMEGGAIPIGSLSISSKLVNKYKLAEILTTTLELKERSVVDIEALFRRAILRAYSKVLDNAILDNSAAVPGVRPAGLLNGLTGANAGTGVSTGGVASVTADISAMVGALLANNQGAVPVLLMNNQDRMSLSFVTSALGEFMFQDQLGAGQVLGVPVVSSARVPAGTVVMVDVSSLAMILDAPMFDISQVAAVVEANADTTPPTMADDGSGAVGTAGQVQDGIPLHEAGASGAGAPAVAVNSTARSLWQTFSEGVRMVAPTSFLMMRSGVVATRNTIAWK
jgi:hypothetical protein